MTTDPTKIKPRLIRLREVLSRVGLSRSTLYEMMAVGDFPAAIPISRQAVAWLESEVDGWIKSRFENRTENRNSRLKERKG